MTLPMKIYPSVQELSTVVTKVCCPEEGCTNVFTSGSNLNLHLAKTHKKAHLLQPEISKREYHCPELSCMYHDRIFFKNLKLLKQHFLKVHGEKSYNCENCEKGFPTETAKRSHSKYCGAVFKCCDCQSFYDCYESLKTHGRRKKHSILEKIAYRTDNQWKIKLTSYSDEKLVIKEHFLLPKVSRSVAMLVTPVEVKKSNSIIHKSMQTESYEPMRNQKAEKREQICAETQTIGEYISKKPEPSDSEESLGRKSINTQTESVDSKSQSCNTSFSFSDFEFSEEEGVERSSSSTQTSVQKTISLNDFDSSFFNCNSETQTDLMFEDEIFNVCDYYSHMYTQTCEDILLDGLGFNDNHTQTVFDDIVRNVESQTIMVHNNKRNTMLACRNMASMETQTDLEFKQMLEEINA